MLHAKKIGLLLGLFGSLSAAAQSTLNSTGGSAVVMGVTHSWSVGEMTVVNTAQGNNIIVTHGVLQPDGGPLAVNNVALAELLEVFPNPAADLIYLRYQFPQAGALQCTLLDATGKTVRTHQIKVTTTGGTEPIDLQGIAAGTYLLRVNLTNDKGGTSAATYTIQKLN